ncbi:MAG: DNA-directed DNA polymerase II small subunit [Candidatus Micrarchaeales archaeon]
MEEELERKLMENEILISKEAFEFLKQQVNSNEIIEKIISKPIFKTKIVEVKDIEEILNEEAFQKIPKVEKKKEVEVQKLSFEVKNVDTGFYTGKIEDFVYLFQDRYKKLQKIIEKRLTNIVDINRVKNSISGREASLIGIVKNKTLTRNGIVIDVEDLTDEIRLYIPKNSPYFKEAQTIVNDEVIGVNGKLTGSLFIVNRLVFPDIEVRNPKKVEKDIEIAFISDLHVGSKLFYSKNFESFLKDLEKFEKLKYLIISGDIVDGIGIYPNQINELLIKDIYKQYEMFFNFLNEIPPNIHVFVAPGNHDATRRAEPQAFEAEMTKSFSNVSFISNPSYINIEGVEILVYHGTSLDSIIASIPGLSYLKPEEAMIQLLKKRHLSPIYGTNPIAPIGKDNLVIETQPDILVMGHVHRNAFVNYKGTIVINAGTWQGKTEFQIKQGHVPTPCLVTFYNIKTSNVRIENYLLNEE